MRGQVIFVMGVAGSGKSTLAQALAKEYSAEFLEGDAFHPPANIAAMSAGQPLTDDMRWGWLSDLATAAAGQANAGRDVLVACSGLRKSYRDLLRRIAGPCRMVLLTGDKAMLLERMAARKDHYMRPEMLDSQFATLELPGAAESDVIVIDVARPSREVLAVAMHQLNAAR